jgi:formiminotetrahydrofolate cyclodeaminase
MGDEQRRPAAAAPPGRAPLGAGSLAANIVAQSALLIAKLARESGDGATAAQAQRIAARAGALSAANDEAFTAATLQLAATARGEGDAFGLEVALAEAAATPRVICEAACDLALLSAEAADTGDGSRRADFIAIAQLSAAAASSAALLVRTNLTVGEDDWRLSSATAAAVEAARAAQRAAALEH